MSNPERPLVYLAAPYGTNETEKLLRHKAVVEITGQLMKEGMVVYSPIAFGPNVEHMLKEWTHDQWLDYDEQLLSRCDKLCVLMLPGWEQSKGVKKELDIARARNMSVMYFGIRRFITLDMYQALLEMREHNEQKGS